MRMKLAACALGLAAVIAGATPAHAASPITLSQGHVDVLDIAYEDGELEVMVHDETVEPGVERLPCEVVFEVKAAARASVPDDPAYAFLGSPGSPTWVLPQQEDANLLFPGLAAEEIAAGQLAGDTVKIKLTSVSGPGGVDVFTVDEFGVPDPILDPAFELAAGSHHHANWAFSAAGWYRLTFKVSARDAATGALVTSDPVTLRFHVSS